MICTHDLLLRGPYLTRNLSNCVALVWIGAMFSGENAVWSISSRSAAHDDAGRAYRRDVSLIFGAHPAWPGAHRERHHEDREGAIRIAFMPLQRLTGAEVRE